MHERMAQYFRLDSWLFRTLVHWHTPEIEFDVVGNFSVQPAGFVQGFDGVSDVVVNVLRHKVHLIFQEELRQVRQ